MAAMVAMAAMATIVRAAAQGRDVDGPSAASGTVLLLESAASTAMAPAGIARPAATMAPKRTARVPFLRRASGASDSRPGRLRATAKLRRAFGAGAGAGAGLVPGQVVPAATGELPPRSGSRTALPVAGRSHG